MFEKSSTEMKLSLHLPSSHPERPHPALLHAICGAASIYTDWVPPTRLPFYGRVPSRALSLTDYLFIACPYHLFLDQIFPDSVKQLLDLPDSFCEHHCRLAFRCIHEDKAVGLLGPQVDVVQG